MADHFVNGYWDGDYWVENYFGSDGAAPGAMFASLSGSGSISAVASAVSVSVTPPSTGGSVSKVRRRRRGEVVSAPLIQRAIVSDISASLAGAGKVAGSVGAAANLAARVGGAGSITAGIETNAEQVRQDNAFWLFAA